MWSPLKTEVNDRFAEVHTFFKATRGTGKQSDKIARGIAFVHIYAAYEYCVRNVTKVAFDAVASHNHRIRDLKPPLMGLFLNPELNSFKDSKGADSWVARTNIFETLLTGRVDSKNAVFPNDGSHYRQGQLHTIFSLFCIRRKPAQRRRHLIRIDEIVNHRNSIAHGHESAESVGSRYSRGEVTQIIREAESVCLLLISTIEKQCSDAKRHCR